MQVIRHPKKPDGWGVRVSRYLRRYYNCYFRRTEINKAMRRHRAPNGMLLGKGLIRDLMGPHEQAVVRATINLIDRIDPNEFMLVYVDPDSMTPYEISVRPINGVATGEQIQMLMQALETMGAVSNRQARAIARDALTRCGLPVPPILRIQ